jgi:hypothetical protein
MSESDSAIDHAAGGPAAADDPPRVGGSWHTLPMALAPRAIFWSAVVFTLVMALIPQPPADLLPGAKVQHLLAFAVLSLLGSSAYPRAKLTTIGLSLVLLGGAIELAQSIPALNRHPSLLDWALDAAAIVATLAAVKLLRGLRRR